MNADDFEHLLRRQTPRQLPPQWREEILAAARARGSTVGCQSWLASLNAQLSTIFWPSPKAWAGLAAAWLVAFSVQSALRDQPGSPAVEVASSSTDVQKALKQQQALLVELIDAPQPTKADRRKDTPPRPRTEIWPALPVA